METRDLIAEDNTVSSPHSLGKLIEWKPERDRIKQETAELSPLAGETN